MKNKTINLILTIISVLIILFFEEYTYKLLPILRININNFTPIVQIIINLIIKIIMCIIIFMVYKKDLKRSRRKKNVVKNILIIIFGFTLLLASSYALSYIMKYLSKILNITLINNNYYNIFTSKIDINNFSYIITNYVINPFIYIIVIILGINKIIKNEIVSSVIVGLVAGLLYSITLKGSILCLIINSIPIFIIYSLLSILYKKTNNIWLILFLRIIYLIILVILANYLGVFI